jgi:predicted secreted protein
MAIRSAKGTLQQIGDGATPEVFTTIGQVRSISGPTTKAQVQDVTTHSTVGNWTEKLATLIDPGTLSFPINYDNADATHMFATGLWADMIALTVRNFLTVFPASMGQLEYAAYITGHSFDVPVDNVLQASIELTIYGALTASQT